ncbi:hypothetical protein CAEBREN_10882 [Caenorhabditis brenneri]|uniref:Uncharacterized protein n=1 Tax=Caenorhabditis brenneri TaxID=135651 RepID=G0MUA0_CAEBE|nr:hypothetical protein CAEBREN_10882 [Caenorhabditis brenneri]
MDMHFVNSANRYYRITKNYRKAKEAKENAKKISSAMDMELTYETEVGKVELEALAQHKLFKGKMLSVLAVLQTTIKKISTSNNENLIDDIIKHRIPERLEYIAIIVDQYKKRLFQTLSDEESQKLDLVEEEIECIQDQIEALMLVNSLSQPAVIRL